MKIFVLRYTSEEHYNEPTVRALEDTEVKVQEIDGSSAWTLHIGEEEPEEFDGDDFAYDWEGHVEDGFEYPALGIYPM